MSSPSAKTIEKGPAAWTEERVTETVGPRGGGTYDAIMALQRGAGNRAVTRLLAGSSGGPLDPTAREDMESSFGADFSDVRIHHDESAAKAALAAGARAITTGRDIVFAEGYYAPATSAGKRLLAHELAHVLQQRGGRERKVSRGTAESEARQAGADVVAGQAASVQASASGGPQADEMTPEEKGRKAAQADGWNVEDTSVTFWISHQVESEASFNAVGGKGSGPGLGSWSNRRVFTIDQGEHTWLHLSFNPDTKEHPIPAEYRDKISVFTDIHYAPANGGPGFDLHLRDNQPQYRATGGALSIKLGSTTPGASDLPVCDLPLDGGGELTWKAGFGFGTGSVAYEVKETFSLRPAVSAPPQQQGATAGAEAPPSASGTPGPAPKGQPLPQPPAAANKQKPPAANIAKINELTELIKKTQDAAKRDPIIRALRDEFAKIQPFMPQKDAKKAIDDAIDSLVKTGFDEAIKAILKGIIGKDPSAVDPNHGPQTGPYAPTPFPSPQVKIPLPLPFDKPPQVPKSFQYHFKDGPRKTYGPGEDIKFTVVPPSDFDTTSGSKRLIIVAEADRSADIPERLGQFDLESSKEAKVQMKAPQKPGKYVIRVDVAGRRSAADSASDQEFEVTEAKKSQ